MHAGSAVCIGLGSFQGDVPSDEEPPADALRDLPYARALTKDLAAALTDLGFSCSVHTEQDLPTAPELGSCVSASLASATSGAHVVHVLSHGHPGNAGVYVVGADGSWDASTRVESWVASVEDHPSRQQPHTLFVVDTCYSGQAARLGWLPAATERTRAWVIAASAPDAPAFNGRLTQAVTTVLRKLKSGELDFRPSTYVPFVHMVEHVRREVVRLGGASQYVTGTPVDGLFEPPLFANPRPALPGSPRVALSEVDSLTSPFGDLDPALDPAHFLDRAAGHRDAALADPVGFFTGRLQQIEELAASLDHDRASGLTVVTGGAGSGKSALLGVLVCALHPRLREPTRHLWHQVPVPGSAWTGPLAAVHLRERTLDEATSALVRQLHLPLPQQSQPREVVEAISVLREVPLIVFDALDEAAEQDAVHRQLLRPLAAAKRRGGGPAAHLWVGTRPWHEFDALLDDARTRQRLIDLDAVPIAQLRAELRDYADDILAHAPAYQDRSLLLARRTLAQGVAEALTPADRDRGGEFLIAALYTHWLQRRSASPADPLEVATILAQVPLDIPAMLNLDLSTRGDQAWLTALLTTLAHAHGAGMPATVLRRAAGAFHVEATSGEISVADFDRLLRHVRFYLRSTPDSDGISLYRLFHQSLVEHLNDPDADLSAFIDRIVAGLPVDDHGQPMPEAAEPYVQRHWIQHAADAGRIELLVSVPPAELVLPLNAAARTSRGRLGTAIYRQSAYLKRFSADIDDRRQLLHLDAIRYGAHNTARRLAAVTATSTMELRPQWATGGSTTPWLRALLAGHSEAVLSVAAGQVEGRSIIVSGSNDSTVRSWDANTGTPMGPPITGHRGPVTSVVIGQVDGRAVIVTGSHDKTIRIWDVNTGAPVISPIVGHGNTVTSVAMGQVEGRGIIVSSSNDNTVRSWDAATGRPIKAPLVNGKRRPTTITIHQVNGQAIIVSGFDDGTVCLWEASTHRHLKRYKMQAAGMSSMAIGKLADRTFLTYTEMFGRGAPHLIDLATGVALGDRLGAGSFFYKADSVAVGEIEGRAFIVSGHDDGSVSIWDAATHEEMGSLHNPGKVTSVTTGQIGERTIIVSGSIDGMVRVWDPPISTPVGTPIVGHDGMVTSIAAGQSDGRKIVVSGSRDMTLRIWDASTGAQMGKTLIGHTNWVNSVAVGQTNGHAIIASGSEDMAVRIWDAETGTQMGNPLVGHTSGVSAVAIGQAEGRTIIVSGSGDQTVRIWDAATRTQIGTPFTGHTRRVTSVAIGQVHGRTIIVSSAGDRTVRVWDVETGTGIVNPLTGHRDWVNAVAVGRVKGQTIIVSGGEDRTIWLRHVTFHRRHPYDRVTYWDKAIATVSFGDESEQELTFAAGYGGCFSVWKDKPGTRISPSWPLPYDVQSIAHVPGLGWAVAFGTEIAVFRSSTHANE